MAMRTSRPITMKTTQKGMALGWLSPGRPRRTKAAVRRILSATGSSHRPSLDLLVPESGRQAVQDVGQPGQEEDQEGPDGLLLEHHPEEDGDEEDPGKGQEVGQGAEFSRHRFSFSLI